MFTTSALETPRESSPRRLQLSIARCKGDLVDAFTLVHESYIRANLDRPYPSGMRLTPYHLLPTTDVLVARQGNSPVATASLVVDGDLGLPAQSIYDAEIKSLRRDGFRLAEVGSLADRRRSPLRFMQMFRQLSRLITQAAAVRGCNGLFAATHPRHARFYIRQIGFRQIGGVKSCPYAKGNPAVALLLDFNAIRGSDVHRHFFAKSFDDHELAPFDWDEPLHRYFAGVLQENRAEASRVMPSVAAATATVAPATVC